jgi:hypothetical protein
MCIISLVRVRTGFFLSWYSESNDLVLVSLDRIKHALEYNNDRLLLCVLVNESYMSCGKLTFCRILFQFDMLFLPFCFLQIFSFYMSWENNTVLCDIMIVGKATCNKFVYVTCTLVIIFLKFPDSWSQTFINCIEIKL